MKLNEIIQTQQSVRQAKDDNESDRQQFVKDNPKASVLGTGKHATVFKHDNRPHDVTKVATPVSGSIKKDGWYIYIKALADNDKMSSNPFFPRVYSLNATTSDGRDSFTAKIEPLEPLNGIDDERELLAILHGMLKKDPYEIYPELERSNDLHRDLLRLIYKQAMYPDAYANRKLIQAFEFIEGIDLRTPAGMDITIQNIFCSNHF